MTEHRHWTAAEVRTLMRRQFCQPMHTILFEVADATGHRHTGFADAIAMNLWPSRGLALEGFEIKVSRYDWLQELKNPAKAEKFYQRCDYWWLVSPEHVVAERSEIPEAWGWLVVEETGLRVARQAPKNPSPAALDRTFLAALMRSAGKADEGLVAQMVDARRKADEDRFKDRVAAEVDRRTERGNGYAAKLAAIEALVGEDGLRWLDKDEFARAVAFVLKTGVVQSWQGIEGLLNSTEAFADRLRTAMAEHGIERQRPAQKRPRRRAA